MEESILDNKWIFWVWGNGVGSYSFSSHMINDDEYSSLRTFKPLGGCLHWQHFHLLLWWTGACGTGKKGIIAAVWIPTSSFHWKILLPCYHSRFSGICCHNLRCLNEPEKGRNHQTLETTKIGKRYTNLHGICKLLEAINQRLFGDL